MTAPQGRIASTNWGRHRANGPPPDTTEVPVMQIDPTWARGLPLRARNGTIRAFAMVDAEDYERLSKLRWCFDNYRWRLVKRSVSGGAEYLHRVVMGLSKDDPRKVDHINRDTLDNRRANLRLATTAENAQNQGSRGGSSKYRGVTWDKSREKWVASVMLHGKRHTIGRFFDEDMAGEAAAEFRRLHMPYSEEAAA